MLGQELKKQRAVPQEEWFQTNISFEGNFDSKMLERKMYVTDLLLLSKYDLYLQSEPTEDWETAATFSEFGSGSITLMFNFALHSTREKEQVIHF